MRSRSVAPRGAQAPVVRHAPSVRGNAWEDVVDVAKAYGLVLDEWQEGVLEAAMGERSDGRWAASRVGVAVPRQNGKGALIEARELAGLLVFGEQSIVHSAHEQRTARVGFDRIRAYFENYDDLRRRVKQIGTAVAREYIELLSGQVLRFPARSKGAIRGFSIDCLLLDEAQILPERAMAAILPTLAARPNPQVWLLGTPPTPADEGEVFTRWRRMGHEGSDRRLCWVEWSAPSSVDPDDRAVWAATNPALGERISYEAVADERAALDEATFRRERLGTWQEAAESGGALPAEQWSALADPDAPRGTDVVFGVDVAEDRTAWVAVAWRREDGAAQVMLANDGAALPAFRLVEECARLCEQYGAAVVPPRAFEDDLERAGVRVESVKQGEFAAACGAFADAVSGGRVRHGNQPALNEAVRHARWRAAGSSGERAFQLAGAPEVGPLAAATRALHGLTTMAEGVLVW